MPKYILITGGETFNKGAQSMTFITVDQMKAAFPNKEIILISNIDYRRDPEEKNQYNFKIMPMNNKLIFDLLGGSFKFVSRLKGETKEDYSYLLDEYKAVLKNTDAIIDISGFALSSQRGFGSSLSYLMRIKLAKKYKIKVFLMPQSFGPFEYKWKHKQLMNVLLKKYLKYPEVIFAREKEGYNLLKNNYKLTNVKLSKDLVLRSEGININNVYNNIPIPRTIKNLPQSGNVAIVPNMKNFAHGNKGNLISIYDYLIKKLIENQKMVYLIRHSQEDLEACKVIKEKFSNNDNVILINDEFSCIEFDNIVKKFDFIIASRYHSIIHAYKNSVPCIAIGWATKYRELLYAFKQEKYIFDVRTNIDEDIIEKALETILRQYKDEAEIIKSVLNEINTENIFDILEA